MTEQPAPQRDAIYVTVRRVMEQNRWTGSEIARRIGLKQPAFARRITGRVSFTAEEMLAIAEVMDCDVRELYGLPVETPTVAAP